MAGLEVLFWVESNSFGFGVEVADDVLGGLSFFSGEYGLGADKVESFEVGGDAPLCCMKSADGIDCTVRRIDCGRKLCRTS